MRRFTFDLHEGADGRTYVWTIDDVMAIKPNFLAAMGYQYFLSYGARRARSSAKKETFAFLLGGESITSQSRGENQQTPPPYGIDLGTEHKTMLWKQQKPPLLKKLSLLNVVLRLHRFFLKSSDLCTGT